MKSQFRSADASGAKLALILGEDELAGGQVAIKDLRGTAEQTLTSLETAAQAIAEQLARR